MTTAFTVGQLVRSTVSAQGLVKGLEYLVADVRVFDGGIIGAVVDYRLVDHAEGKFNGWVANGHILLEEVPS